VPEIPGSTRISTAVILEKVASTACRSASLSWREMGLPSSSGVSDVAVMTGVIARQARSATAAVTRAAKLRSRARLVVMII